MKILFVTHMFPSHPEDKNGKFIYDSINALHKNGHAIKVIVTKPWKPKWFGSGLLNQEIQLDKFPAWLQISICYFPSIPKYYCYFLSLFSYKIFTSPIIKKVSSIWGCDVIHVHSESHSYSIVNLAKKLNIPVVTTIHGVEATKKYWKSAGRIIRNGLEKTARIILVGDSIKNYFTYLSDKISIIYNGFSLPKEILRLEPKPWLKKLYFISISNLFDDSKGIDINLKAFGILKKEGIINWEYTIVGDGCFKKEFELLAGKLDIKDQVNFVGSCDHNLIHEYLLKVNIFTLPSYREAFGIAHLEAMACGLLVIGVRGQGPEAFISHGKTGLLVNPEDSIDLANIFKNIFKNPEEMQKIALRGKKFAWENFSWDIHAKKLTTVYDEICAK